MKKKLNLSSMKAVNGFVEANAHPVDIEFEIDGEKHEYQVFVRKFRFDTFTGLSNNEDASINLVWKGIVDENCKELFTYDQACSLHPGLATALINAVTEVNTFKKKS